MKEILTQLNPVFDHRNRLGIMSILAVNDWVEYNTLKELLDLTDGKLPLEANECSGSKTVYRQKTSNDLWADRSRQSGFQGTPPRC